MVDKVGLQTGREVARVCGCMVSFCLIGRKVIECDCEVEIKNESGRGRKRILELTIYTYILPLVGDQVDVELSQLTVRLRS